MTELVLTTKAQLQERAINRLKWRRFRRGPSFHKRHRFSTVRKPRKPFKYAKFILNDLSLKEAIHRFEVLFDLPKLCGLNKIDRNYGRWVRYAYYRDAYKSDTEASGYISHLRHEQSPKRIIKRFGGQSKL